MVLRSLSWILTLKKYYIWNKKFLLTRNIKKKITPFICGEKEKGRKIVLIMVTLWYLPLLEILLRNPRLRTGSKALGLHERSWRAVIPSSSLSPTKGLFGRRSSSLSSTKNLFDREIWVMLFVFFFFLYMCGRKSMWKYV